MSTGKTQPINLEPKNLEVQEIVRDKILYFENVLREYPDAIIGDSDTCPLKHTFADGFYVRQITIPKGMIIVGKIHKHEHPNFLLKGEVTVITEGGGMERLKAPCSIISPAGTKRVVITHKKTVWVTVHANKTNTRDLVELERQIIAKDYDEFEKLESKKGGVKCLS